MILALTITPRQWFHLGFYILLLFGIYFSSYHWLTTVDWSRGDFSHSYLIPIVVAYLIWEKRHQLEQTPSNPSWMGVPFLVFGLLLFWLGELSGEFFSLYLSSWFVLVGLCWVHLGWHKLKTIAFPLSFILTMFPIPNFLYGKVSFQLRLISSKLGVDMMQAWGMTAFREGNVIDLGFTQLQVVDACNGLRYLIPLIVLGLLLAYFYKAPMWKRVVLVLSTIPISIVVNAGRIASVGILYKYWGPMVAEGFFHDFSGWLIFMVSLGLLLGEMAVLQKVPGSRFKVQGSEKQIEEGEGQRAEDQASLKLRPAGRGLRADDRKNDLKSWRSFLRPPQFVVAVVLLGLTFVISQGVEFREKVQVSRPFSEFPKEIGEWQGEFEPMEQMFIDTLDLSDYTIIDYRNEEGRNVNFYVAFYESQRKGESIHSPATCLPGGGWEFKWAGSRIVPLSVNGMQGHPVNRALMQKGDFKQLTYYWFPMRGRVLTNAYQMKLFNFWDALTRQRTDGALVRVITPVYEDEEVGDAEGRLQGFMGELVPVLGGFLPD